MNFHSDLWIMQNVINHLHEAQSLVPREHIVGIFYQGSGNYGLDYEGSDVDTKCIITPAFKEIALARKSMNTTHIRANNEHIDMKDIRLYIQTFRKQNLNFLEILFTPYCWFPNEHFFYQWQRLVDYREEITHYNPVRSVKSMKGIAAEKYHAMEHRYPSRIEIIDKFGYDPKQLYHLLRVAEFLDRYMAEEPFAECLKSKQADYLKKVKEGCVPLEEARVLATAKYNYISNRCDNFIAVHEKDEINKEVDELLEDVSYEIMKISVQQDIWNESGVSYFN